MQSIQNSKQNKNRNISTINGKAQGKNCKPKYIPEPSDRQKKFVSKQF